VTTALLGRLLIVAAVGFAAGPAAPETSGAAEPAPPSEQAPPTGEDVSQVPAAKPDALHVVLPCGLRVIVAKDGSLPVAAVVLAVDVGTEDDPEERPGLIHALSYHLQQGNRELQPGQAVASAHDVGGIASMAVGHAQVRFESLVPVSQLDRTLWVESQRLRAPTVNETLWLKSLTYARSDRRPKYPVPANVLATAWQRPGLGHDGHAVGKALSKMKPADIEAELARLFDYRRATLVVVTPRDPKAVLDRVTSLFSELPQAKRDVAVVAPPPGTSADPRQVEVPKQRGDTMVWPVPGTPDAKAWAQVTCASLNRQRRGPDDGPKSRLRCTFVDDARRPLLAVRASGVDDPVALAKTRLARVQAGEEAKTVGKQQARFRKRLESQLHLPLPLARHLATTDPTAATEKVEMVQVHALTGVQALAPAQAGFDLIPGVFDLSAATLLLPAHQAKQKKDKSKKKADKKPKPEAKP
jgi:hypothetical protein